MSQRKLLQKIGLYAVLTVGVIISLFPFYWAMIGATNESGKMFSSTPTLVPGTKLIENITNLNESIGIGRVMFNSLFVAGTYTVLSLIICTMAAYAFAKFHFKGRNVIFTIFLLSMMIPYHATVIPLFKMMAAFGWLNTYKALILPNLAYPFAIFLMRQNMLAFPDALIEAARIDGAGEWRIFFRIVLPSMKPALAATAIFLFMYQWNSFLWPLIAVSSEEMYTFPVALSSLFGLSRIDYGQVMAGVTLATVPIIVFFLALQRHFISGMLGSAVK
ncbi:carbohydrate ABC transporter membrane protein 2 (CUT1 family) [Anoxybacillus vitaminiphilus]|uniref:Carbohydrate ABC transporter membrane protein 2 (CUT1 family) n=1 Tax=Paranoxybacillus vitaminiphilus TaxID=581036 RepID=A0A327YLY6_9BACL|nr:carbohydrate ABC transporter permease [Anoxybacillus vitaminiphilus]RAK22094.1 carbohydrate ABC transporter membrane protein 2 (CUT1 family) [Anoxybacillus vitaminiphilus]